jgi:hypothetical protein
VSLCIGLLVLRDIVTIAGVVKLRRGETAKLFQAVKSMPALYKTFRKFADDMEARYGEENFPICSPNFLMSMEVLCHPESSITHMAQGPSMAY